MLLSEEEKELIGNKNLISFVKLLNLDEDLKILNNKLITLINDYDNVSTKDLVKFLETDAMLVSKILRLINSPYWGLVEPIKSIKQAVILLGRLEVKNIILMTAYSNQTETFSLPKDKMKKLLLESYISGIVIKVIFEKFDEYIPYNSEEGFILGLLHNLGKLFIGKYLNNVIPKIEDFWNSFEVDSQIKYLGFSHIDVSSFILKKIGFDQISEQLSMENEHKFVKNIVYLSDLIATKVLDYDYDISYIINDDSPYFLDDNLFIENSYVLELLGNFDLEKLKSLF